MSIDCPKEYTVVHIIFQIVIRMSPSKQPLMEDKEAAVLINIVKKYLRFLSNQLQMEALEDKKIYR